jgi:predicted phosphodiesterase
MRIFAISDLHLDYADNRRWLEGISFEEYREDVLILAGDISDSIELVVWCFGVIKKKFKTILFVPGNHDLWIIRDEKLQDSVDKFRLLCDIADNCGISRKPFHSGVLSIVPLLSWYDYSFGKPTDELYATWMDYRACKWPVGASLREVAAYFAKLNEDILSITNRTVISFSHFVPRIDVMPAYIPPARKRVYPVLGTELLERQIRCLQPAIHIYGHSHVNQRVPIDGIFYINNAFGYPEETRIAAKQLLCVWEG